MPRLPSPDRPTMTPPTAIRTPRARRRFCAPATPPRPANTYTLTGVPAGVLGRDLWERTRRSAIRATRNTVAGLLPHGRCVDAASSNRISPRGVTSVREKEGRSPDAARRCRTPRRCEVPKRDRGGTCPSGGCRRLAFPRTYRCVRDCARAPSRVAITVYHGAHLGRGRRRWWPGGAAPTARRAIDTLDPAEIRMERGSASDASPIPRAPPPGTQISSTGGLRSLARTRSRRLQRQRGGGEACHALPLPWGVCAGDRELAWARYVRRRSP